jgi:hypothetical protein
MYYWSLESGLIILMQAFMNVSEQNDTLFMYLNRPVLNILNGRARAARPYATHQEEPHPPDFQD